MEFDTSAAQLVKPIMTISYHVELILSCARMENRRESNIIVQSVQGQGEQESKNMAKELGMARESKRTR